MIDRVAAGEVHVCDEHQQDDALQARAAQRAERHRARGRHVEPVHAGQPEGCDRKHLQAGAAQVVDAVVHKAETLRVRGDKRATDPREREQEVKRHERVAFNLDGVRARGADRRRLHRPEQRALVDGDRIREDIRDGDSHEARAQVSGEHNDEKGEREDAKGVGDRGLDAERDRVEDGREHEHRSIIERRRDSAEAAHGESGRRRANVVDSNRIVGEGLGKVEREASADNARDEHDGQAEEEGADRLDQKQGGQQRAATDLGRGRRRVRVADRERRGADRVGAHRVLREQAHLGQARVLLRRRRRRAVGRDLLHGSRSLEGRNSSSSSLKPPC
mmetsp:Transcript_18785/g.47920  ORF Transcript_18785/g.47920 Transcript_18785/m.47920 type:complete len:333 (-) Transcript_18785:46-1044(-)